MFKLARSGVGINHLLKISIDQQRNIRIRKPPWEPRAKSKLFRVPPEKSKDIEEYNYIIPIWREYKAQMRSVYQLFKTEFKFSDKESLKAQEEKRVKMKEEENLLQLNQNFNMELLDKQLKDEEVKLEDKKKQVEKEYLEKLNLEKNYREIAKKKLIRLSEKSKNFIDPNNLEYEIEKMLNERHDYNFSIDYIGRVYKGQVKLTREQVFDTTFVPPVNESIPNEPGLINASHDTSIEKPGS